MKKYCKIAFISLLVIMFCHSFASDEVSNPNLGPFALSVKKFDDEKALDKHHEHLLQEALNTKNSVLLRYTYAMLLGINEPTPLTRDMAINALNVLAKDPSVTNSDKQTIGYIRNLMLYQKNRATNTVK